MVEYGCSSGCPARLYPARLYSLYFGGQGGGFKAVANADASQTLVFKENNREILSVDLDVKLYQRT